MQRGNGCNNRNCESWKFTLTGSDCCTTDTTVIKCSWCRSESGSWKSETGLALKQFYPRLTLCFLQIQLMKLPNFARDIACQHRLANWDVLRHVSCQSWHHDIVGHVLFVLPKTQFSQIAYKPISNPLGERHEPMWIHLFQQYAMRPTNCTWMWFAMKLRGL